MKKNANVLEYVEKYKFKYGISYPGENVKLIKGLTVSAVIVWAYTFFWSLMIILGTIFDLKRGNAFADGGKNSYITIISCTIFMLIAAVLLCFKQKVVATAILILTQPAMIIAFAHSTENVTGIGHIAAFYWRHTIPSIILILLSIIIFVLLVSAKVNNNRLYDMLVDGLYKQYGKKDGEALSETEWDEFLTHYNPYKRMD